MIKTIKDAVERYGEDIYDIVNNSPSRSNAYFRGLELGGPVLAILCAVWCLRHLSATADSGHYPYQEETSDIGCISASRSKMGDGGGRYRPLLSAGMLCGSG